MKHPDLKKLLPALMLAGISFLGACKKENEEAPAVTEEEAVALISEAITDAGSGLVVTINTVVDIATTYNTYCGVSKDSTVSRSLTGSVSSWNASLHWTWMLACDGTLPSAFDFSMEGTSDFDAPRIQSDDDVTATLEVTGMAPADGSYSVSADLERSGSQTSKVGNRNSFSASLRYTSGAITVSKANGQITGGTVTVMLSGESTRGRSFSYGGTLVFQGNDKATLTLDNGGVYTIIW